MTSTSPASSSTAASRASPTLPTPPMSSGSGSGDTVIRQPAQEASPAPTPDMDIPPTSRTAPGTVEVSASWTRGLAVHAVACVVTGIAWLLSFSEHVTVTLIASLVSFLAALLTLIAFALDIALFAWTKHQIGNLGISSSTYPGIGFWFTLATFILLLLAGCTVCFGHRRERITRGGNNNYAMDGAPWYRRGFGKGNAV